MSRLYTTSPSFPKDFTTLLKNKISDRQLYYYLLNVEDYFPLLPVAWNRALQSLQAQQSVETLFDNELLKLDKEDALQLLALSKLRNSIADLLPQKLSEICEKSCLYYLLNQYSPLALIDGCWLSASVSLKNVRHEYGGLLLKIHSEKVGDGILENNHAHVYKQMADSIKLHFPDVFAWEYITSLDREDYAFNLPVFLLSLSQFPSLLLPEILGVNLLMALFDVPLFKDLVLSCDSNINDNYFKLKEKRASAIIGNSLRSILHYLSTIENSEVADELMRVQRGFSVAYAMMKSFYGYLYATIANPQTFSPENKVRKIIQKIGVRAYGYHKKGKIGGKPINEWFNHENFDPQKILVALAGSSYVKPGDPDKSHFINKLVSSNGPMFRIFSNDDIDIFRDWIKTLQSTNEKSKSNLTENLDLSEIPNSAEIAKDPLPFISFKESTEHSKTKYSKSRLSDLYYYLLHIDMYPDVLPVAKEFAIRWLRRNKTNILRGKLPIPFKNYSHERLEQWLEQKHREQVDSYVPLEGYPEESKENVVRTAVRLAPLTYIDGAWVRRMTAPTIVNTDVGGRLYHIYVDELGNGEIDIHHGNIYRELVKQLGISLPDFESPEFPKDKHFDEDCLQVPVFWLSISSFPRTFFPEILGLNLAMELSGIGGEYRRSGDVLRYYGYSSRFLDIHNTIDNIVSGHTAWAMESIKTHLDEIMQKGGRQLVQQHWYRIWVGYRSLTPARGIKPYFVESLSRLFKRYDEHQCVYE